MAGRFFYHYGLPPPPPPPCPPPPEPAAWLMLTVNNSDDHDKLMAVSSYDLGTGKPDVQLTVESATPALAQVGSWEKDSQSN